MEKRALTIVRGIALRRVSAIGGRPGCSRLGLAMGTGSPGRRRLEHCRVRALNGPSGPGAHEVFLSSDGSRSRLSSIARPTRN